MEKEFNKLGIKYYKLVGNTPVNKRVKMVDEFNNDSSIKVFLISLKAGGTGLNLIARHQHCGLAGARREAPRYVRSGAGDCCSAPTAVM